jgi:hypothetical protein
MSESEIDTRCGVYGCPVVRYLGVKTLQPTFGYVEELRKEFCEAHFDQWVQMKIDLPLAIQELHALALLAPAISDGHGHSIFQDWWPCDIRETQMRALARVLQLRKLEAEFRGESA